MTIKFKGIMTLFTAMSLLLCTACDDVECENLVAHNDMDKIISEAKMPAENKSDMTDLQQYENYKTELYNKELDVKVKVDANVDIPQTDKLSVFKVKRKEFTQEEVDKVRMALLGDTQLCDGVAATIRTKKDVEADMAEAKRCIEANKDDSEMVEEYQMWIDELQAEYDDVPDKGKMNPIDAKLINVSEKYNENPEDDYWSWQHDLNPDGEVLYTVSEDKKSVFYVQNNADHGSKIHFDSSIVEINTTVGGLLYDGVTVNETNLQNFMNINGVENYITHGFDMCDGTQKPITDNSVSLTLEDSQKKAEEFLAEIGVNDFTFLEGGLYNENMKLNQDYYRNCYILKYCREINGVPLMQTSGTKHHEGWEGDEYVKQTWSAEMIEFRIDDSGIIGFKWNCPLEITETLVEQTTIKSFDEVKDTFENMIAVNNINDEPDVSTEIDIDRVTLSYSRISDKDNYDTGLIVPVWAFHGRDKLSYYMPDESYYRVQMCINAIDGTVIDESLGY